MDAELMLDMRRRRRVTGGSAWSKDQYQSYRRWLHMMSRNDSQPYETTNNR